MARGGRSDGGASPTAATVTSRRGAVGRHDDRLVLHRGRRRPRPGRSRIRPTASADLVERVRRAASAVAASSSSPAPPMRRRARWRRPTARRRPRGPGRPGQRHLVHELRRPRRRPAGRTTHDLAQQPRSSSGTGSATVSVGAGPRATPSAHEQARQRGRGRAGEPALRASSPRRASDLARRRRGRGRVHGSSCSGASTTRCGLLAPPPPAGVQVRVGDRDARRAGGRRRGRPGPPRPRTRGRAATSRGRRGLLQPQLVPLARPGAAAAPRRCRTPPAGGRPRRRRARRRPAPARSWRLPPWAPRGAPHPIRQDPPMTVHRGSAKTVTRRAVRDARAPPGTRRRPPGPPPAWPGTRVPCSTRPASPRPVRAGAAAVAVYRSLPGEPGTGAPAGARCATAAPGCCCRVLLPDLDLDWVARRRRPRRAPTRCARAGDRLGPAALAGCARRARAGARRGPRGHPARSGRRLLRPGAGPAAAPRPRRPLVLAVVHDDELLDDPLPREPHDVAGGRRAHPVRRGPAPG